MITPGVRLMWPKVCVFLLTVVGMAFGLDLLAMAALILGWIDIDRFAATIEDGLILLVLGLVAAGVALVRAHVRSLRIRRRIRRNLLGSLGGDSLSAAGGRTSPVDAVGPVTTALPDSSTVVDLDQHRGRR